MERPVNVNINTQQPFEVHYEQAPLALDAAALHALKELPEDKIKFALEQMRLDNWKIEFQKRYNMLLDRFNLIVYTPSVQFVVNPDVVSRFSQIIVSVPQGNANYSYLGRISIFEATTIANFIVAVNHLVGQFPQISIVLPFIENISSGFKPEFEFKDDFLTKYRPVRFKLVNRFQAFGLNIALRNNFFVLHEHSRKKVKLLKKLETYDYNELMEIHGYLDKMMNKEKRQIIQEETAIRGQIAKSSHIEAITPPTISLPPPIVEQKVLTDEGLGDLSARAQGFRKSLTPREEVIEAPVETAQSFQFPYQQIVSGGFGKSPIVQKKFDQEDTYG